MWINGMSFLYQQFISLLYTGIFITGCITFDKEIMSFCEQSGFILRSSRRNKFYIFFFCMIVYIIIYEASSGLGDAWTNNLEFVQIALLVS